MCLLINLRGVFPPEHVLKAGETQNRHGMGIAFPDGNRVQFYKGITFEELMSFKDSVTHGLIHFRLASIGSIGPELCHPFPVDLKVSTRTSGRVKQVLAHNGHWHKWQDMMLANTPHYRIPAGEFSDTRAMALLTAVHGSNFLELIDEKVVLLGANTHEVFGSPWQKRKGYDLSYDPIKSYQRSSYQSAQKSYHGWTSAKSRGEDAGVDYETRKPCTSMILSDDLEFIPESDTSLGRYPVMLPTETYEQYQTRCILEEEVLTENEEGYCGAGYLDEKTQDEIRALIAAENGEDYGEVEGLWELEAEGGSVVIYDD